MHNMSYVNMIHNKQINIHNPQFKTYSHSIKWASQFMD